MFKRKRVGKDKRDRYTYNVIKFNGTPLHFVYTVTDSYAGVEVFSNKNDADDIMYMNHTLGIPYDCNLSIPTEVVRQYKDNEHLFSKPADHHVLWILEGEKKTGN